MLAWQWRLQHRQPRCPLAWPQPTDYNEAIQNARVCFSDPHLQAGEVVGDALGVPRPHSGNFADVYQVRGPNGHSWAVKCFTRQVGSLQSRYQAISQHLQKGSPPFMVQFQYFSDGIRVGGKWYPILKMEWVEGFTLNEFVRQYVDNPQVMYRLAKMWVKLSLQLRRANMAHADLQHGNALLVPGEKASQLSLRLIDYDGLCVPALANTPSGEVGHPNYQHPQRLANGIYNSEVDRFPHLVIYTALRSLTVGGRQLWDKYDNGENLLFREQDFRCSTESKLLLDLWQLPDPDMRRLLGHLLLGSQLPLDRVPMLDEVVGAEGRPLGLTGGQERSVLDLLPSGAARMKMPPAIVSDFTLEELVAEMDDQPLGASARRQATIALAQAATGGNAASAAAHVRDISASPGDQAKLVRPVGRPAVLPRRRAKGGTLLFPWLRWRCRACGDEKHLLAAICPHCNSADWKAFALAAIVAISCLVITCVGLSRHEPGILGVAGGLAGLGAVLAFPLAAGLLADALRGPQKLHADAMPGVRWPAAREICPRCGRVNVMPLFCCRLCGRLSWARLAMVSAFAIAAATMVAISQPSPEAARWWVALAMLFDWLGRLLAAIAAFGIFIGTLEVWRLQPRLPKEGRIFRSLLAQVILVAATLLPLLCVALLVFGMYYR
jgi:uncharacterized OB-fold protein